MQLPKLVNVSIFDEKKTVAVNVIDIILGNHNSNEDVPLPIQVRVPGCTTAPCTVVAGQTVNAQFDFVASGYTEKVEGKVHYITGCKKCGYFSKGIRFGCDALTGASCPLKLGDHATYNLKLEVPTEIAGPLPIEITLYDDEYDDFMAEPIWCAAISMFVK